MSKNNNAILWSIIVLCLFFELAFVFPVFADDTVQATPVATKKTVNLVCMQTAVSRRDTAIISAFATYGVAMNHALTSRRDDLVKSWTMQNIAQRRKSVRDVWTAYRLAIKKAQVNLREVRKDGWQQYTAARKKCGGETEPVRYQLIDLQQ